MSRLLFVVVVIVMVLSGCVTQQGSPVARIPFPENEYAQLSKEGTAIVRGQGFLKTRGGDVKLCAGEKVELNPVTAYSNQWYEVNMIKQLPLTPGDSRQEQYIRNTMADGNGRFEFRNVAAGEYYVTTLVSWEAPVGYKGSLVQQGGLVSRKIKVSEGEVVDVILTR